MKAEQKKKKNKQAKVDTDSPPENILPRTIVLRLDKEKFNRTRPTLYPANDYREYSVESACNDIICEAKKNAFHERPRLILIERIRKTVKKFPDAKEFLIYEIKSGLTNHISDESEKLAGAVLPNTNIERQKNQLEGCKKVLEWLKKEYPEKKTASNSNDKKNIDFNTDTLKDIWLPEAEHPGSI